MFTRQTSLRLLAAALAAAGLSQKVNAQAVTITFGSQFGAAGGFPSGASGGFQIGGLNWVNYESFSSIGIRVW